MQICLKMAIKVTIFSLPGVFILAVAIIYYVNAQKNYLQNTNSNKVQRPIALTESPIRYTTRTPRSSSQHLSTEIQRPTIQCPAGSFKCSIKTNSLHQVRLRARGFACVDNSLLCNGNLDCYNGEDEENCEDNDNPQLENCYLCRNSNGVCIEKDNLCDGIPDCPEEDDEEGCHQKGELSNNRNKIPFPVNVSDTAESTHGSQSSSFTSHQNGNANISIVNQRGLNTVNPEDDNRDRKLQAPSAGTGSVSGVGFNFQVENFVIYNSQVKMFNQDSENVDLVGNKKGSFLDKIKEHRNPGNFTNGPPPGANISSTAAPSSSTIDNQIPLSDK